jgi:hypothetical protein
MRHLSSISLFLFLHLAGIPAALGQTKGANGVSFEKGVFPIIQKYCLPCHAEESANRSGLSLDTHALLMKGGEHGTPVVPGKPEESLLLKKLGDPPPFGDRMPPPRRRRTSDPPKQPTEEEIRLLTDWIKEGAPKN